MDMQALLQTPRWATLAAFAQRWYAEPLGAAGVTEDDFARTEARLGCQLPPALREWFSLVGHRLQFCGQDDPTRLEDLAGGVEAHEPWRAQVVAPRDGRIVVWRENQGCWFAEVEVGPSAMDGTVLLTSARGKSGRRDRLERALLGMVCSDTLVAAWSGSPEGPLGRLKPDIVGGYLLESTPEIDARAELLPPLEIPNTPLWDTPFRGRDSLVIRSSGDGWEWMAAGGDAHAEARRVFALDDGAGLRSLVVIFDPLPLAARAALQRWTDARFPLGGAGRLLVASLAPELSQAWLEFETTDPEGTLRQLLARLPPEATTVARAGHRPQGTTRFVPCWPPGSEGFSLPPSEDRPAQSIFVGRGRG